MNKENDHNILVQDKHARNGYPVLFPIAFLLLTVLVFFYPYLFLGKTYVPFDLLTWSQPWGDTQFRSVQNHFSWDVARQMVPMQRQIAESIFNFELPLWNPYNNLGFSQVSLSVPVFLDIFNILYLFSADIQMDVVIAALKIWVSGIGMFALMRYYRISQTGAILGGVAFMFNGLFVTLHSFYWGLGPILWTPYIILFLEKSLKHNSRFVNIAVAGLFLGFSHLAGNAQNMIQIFVFLTIWMFSRIYSERNGTKRFYQIILFNLTLSGVISLLVAATAIIPFLELLAGGARNHVLDDSHTWISYSYNNILKIPFLISLAIPHFLGHHSILSPVSFINGKWSDFVYGYAGFLPIVLAYIAGFREKNNKTDLFRNIGITSIAFIFLTPLFLYIYMRFLVFFAFCVAFLSGAGFDYLIRQENRKNALEFGRWLLVFSFLLITIWVTIATIIYFYSPLFFSMGKHYINSRPIMEFFPQMFDFNIERLHNTLNYFSFENIMLQTTVLVPLIFGIVLLLFYHRIIRSNTVGFVVILLTCFDLGCFFFSYVPIIDPKEFSTIPKDKSFTFLNKNLSIERFTTINDPNKPWIFPELTNLYFKMYFTFGVQEFTLPIYKFYPMVTLKNPGFLNLLNVKYILTSTDDVDQDRYPLVHDGKFKIHLNPHALPRVFTVGNIQEIESDSKLIESMVGEDFFPEKSVLFSDHYIIPELGPNTPSDTVTIESYAPREVLIRTNNINNRVLVISDIFNPGWMAYLDGEPVPIYRAYTRFRAVFLPSGEHSIKFTYRPFSTTLGLWISISAMGCILLVLTYRALGGNRSKLL
ncbi:MAG: YfhO family protein [Nitrospirae bacterium]|nr:YfhO family protein [Magnetococcales bacterium]HAT51027.1 hypothetical protein [Alphaproteobacteria bacterium]